MVRPIVLIPHLFWLAAAIIFRKDYSPPPLVRHLDLTSGIRVRSLICGLHQPERMANFGLDVGCGTYIFDGTHYARWKRHMLDHFHYLGPKAWWIIVVGFSRDALDKDNLTQA